MELYKLKEGALISQSTDKDLIIDGVLYSPVSESVLRSNGWKDLITTPHECEWYEVETCNYTEDDIAIYENWSVKAADNLKESYYQRLNTAADIAIVCGFIFIDENGVSHQVWLNLENQWNYSNESAPCELKLNTEDWLQFDKASELDRFKNEAGAHIRSVLSNCWIEKKVVKDLTNDEIYSYLQSL